MTAKEELVALLAPTWNWTQLQTPGGDSMPLEETELWKLVERYAQEEHEALCDGCEECKNCDDCERPSEPMERDEDG